jgi:AcrR family transcriptional regulator
VSYENYSGKHLDGILIIRIFATGKRNWSKNMSLSKDEIIKAEILAQAQKLFQQFGLKKTTMDEIALACGKAKSTLYHYFNSKEEVFDAVIQMEMINLRQYVKDKVEEHKKMVDKLQTYIVEFNVEILNRRNLYHIVKQDNMIESIAKKHFFHMLDYEKSYIVRIMEDGYDSGEYRDFEREDIPWIAELFLAAFYGMVQYSVERDGAFDEEKLTKAALLFVPKLFS